ncbi:DUF4340 domain-containing protein [Terricaulis silvestris]|uniref:DUF4340 domain-containing protein n=1 Tax=Terricaulis silvestris TaxID=2686094 RepID=A0A6I6MJM3_9CAUL|nr:DUF4340 domain-containing protein [Terricaulis silvestris]QGZ95380.1 hypothetical protein DSM104635_02229 [Terricaulis silvestris]
MSTNLAERRKGRALTLALIAGALVAIAAVTAAIEFRSARPDLASGLVLPGLEDQIQDGQRIIITSADATYRIERAQRGESSVWVMRDRGDYPVLPARLAQLTEGLEQLRFTRRMTADPSKHQRLGVTDPREGGRGVLVQVEDARGALLVNLILGVEASGLYVRRPDDPQTWAAQGELPPLRDVASWLELRPIDMSADRLARVEIMPAQGRAYILARDSAEQPWRIAVPALAAMAQSSVAAAAERITQVSPVDVQPAPAIQGTAIARVRATTFDGVAIDAELIPSDGQTWLKLVARAGAPEQEPAALEINNRVAPWAYALSGMDVDGLAPPLVALVPGIGPPQ